VDGQQAAPFVVAEADDRVERRPHAAVERLAALRLQQRHHAREMGRADRPGVVYEDVDRAELALDVLERGIDGGAVADVGVHRKPVTDGVDRLLGRLEPEIERGHARAVGGQPVADRLADARSAARDDRDRHGTATSRPRLAPAASRS
jgi:hypothetical protein